jgi:hypothetical protein
MTYCIGWARYGVVYLVGDSAITGPAPARASASSFGEAHTTTRGRTSQEGILKIAPIAASAAVAVAGDVELGRQIVHFLRDNFDSSQSIIELLNTMTASMGPFQRDRPVELLVASAPLDAQATLTNWNTVDGIDSRDTDVFHIGNLEEGLHRQTVHVLQRLHQDNCPPDLMLPAVTSVVQAYGIPEELMRKGVGGTVFGLWVTQGKTRWQEPTIYLLNDTDQSRSGIVRSAVRDDVLVVDSSFSAATRAFPSVLRRDPPPWVYERYSPMEYLASWTHWRYWAVISPTKRIVLLIYRPNPEVTSHFIDCGVEPPGAFRQRTVKAIPMLLDAIAARKHKDDKKFSVFLLRDDEGGRAGLLQWLQNIASQANDPDIAGK